MQMDSSQTSIKVLPRGGHGSSGLSNYSRGTGGDGARFAKGLGLSAYQQKMLKRGNDNDSMGDLTTEKKAHQAKREVTAAVKMIE